MATSVSLVLGSGGARGLAHIGVIRCLEDRGYHIDYVAGAPIGALIGGIYAAGKLDDYAEWVCALQRRDIVRLLDWSFGGQALFKGERIIEVLRELVGERDIEELPIGFTAVAAELLRGREVWLNRGPLFDAIRASIAMPSVFAPVRRGGRLFVDGGLIDPVPVAPTLNRNNDITLAVDLNGPREQGLPPQERASRHETEVSPRGDAQDYAARITQFLSSLMPSVSEQGTTTQHDEPSMVELVTRSMDIMQTTIANFRLAAYDPVVIMIPRNVCGFFEFHRARALIDLGYRRAAESLDRNPL